jgi:hypothetical protein
MERSKSTHPAREALVVQKNGAYGPQDNMQRNASSNSDDSGYVSDHPASAFLPHGLDGPPIRSISPKYPRAKAPSPYISRPSSTRSSTVSLQSPSAGNSSVKSTRELVLELWQISQEDDDDDDKDTHNSLHTHDRISNWAHDVSSPRTTTAGSRTSNSPKSSTTSTSISSGDVTKASTSASKRSSERNDEDEGPAKKKPNDNQGSFAIEWLQQPPYLYQMPCPMLELHDCQGTNTTISELLRSLMNRHRILICKECCARIPIEGEEKRLGNVLQKHATGCDRRCIGKCCAASSDSSALHHRRTKSCPSWATLTKEARWAFIWTLVNPEMSPPHPNFLPGPAFEHSQERKPCKQQARARGNEICAHLMRDIEAKERRISKLENDLVTAETHEAQLKQCFDKKTEVLEDIIEDLLERVSENTTSIPGSLQKRLLRECPRLTGSHTFLRLTSHVYGPPPVPLLPTYAHYQRTHITPTATNMFYPPPFPPPASTMSNLPTAWGAPHQQMARSGTDDYNPDIGYVDATANAMYSSTVTMNAQGGGYNSPKISETLQPYE